MRRQEPFPDGIIFNLPGRRERVPARAKSNKKAGQYDPPK
jgi:hypothetical protein